MDSETRDYASIDEASKCASNVSPDVLEQHYDQRTEKEKMEQRRGYLSNL